MKFGMKKVVQQFAPPEPIHSGKGTGVTGSFKFDENIKFFRYFRNIAEPFSLKVYKGCRCFRTL